MYDSIARAIFNGVSPKMRIFKSSKFIDPTFRMNSRHHKMFPSIRILIYAVKPKLYYWLFFQRFFGFENLKMGNIWFKGINQNSDRWKLLFWYLEHTLQFLRWLLKKMKEEIYFEDWKIIIFGEAIENRVRSVE